MKPEPGSHFESIESAHDFVGLLSETVSEAKKEVDTDIEKALDSQSERRLQALRMVSYKLDKLAVHMKQSCRILNDLRTLRRLMFEERAAAKTSKPPQMAKPAPALPAKPTPAAAPAVTAATVVRPTPARGSVVAA